MRKIGIPEVEDIATGAALLGAGGGGDPYVGKRVIVLGLRCFEMWRCEAGLELVGPRYFGVDTDYIPLEERCKEVCLNV